MNPLRTLRHQFATAARAAIDFAFPPTCPLCNNEAPSDECVFPSFCNQCRDELVQPVQFACEVCGAPVGQFVDSSKGCGECKRNDMTYKRVVRLGVYSEALRKAIIKAKDRLQEPLMAACGRLLVEECADELIEPRPDLLVPIPQHWSNRLISQHNTAEVLANVIGRMLSLPISHDTLTRARRTAPQKRCPNVESRKANQRGSFALNTGHKLAGKKVLLVDDVFTTGSTANEASRTLRRAGAKITGIAVIARVLSTKPVTNTAAPPLGSRQGDSLG